MVSFVYSCIGGFECSDIVIDLEILVLIKSYKIELIEYEKDEEDEDIEEVCTHGGDLVLQLNLLFLQYGKISNFPIEL